MADTTLTSVPASTYAGDTLAWLISLPNFPASDGWTLAYGFRAVGYGIDLTSTASGRDHLVSSTAVATSQWLATTYSGVARVSSGTTSHTIWKGKLVVLPSLIDITTIDPRTPARICLDNLLLVAQGKASRDVLNTTIAGQSIGRMSWQELTGAIAYWQDIVDSETAAENAANGQGNGRNVLIRFGNP